MNLLKTTALISLLLWSASTLAHSDGHGKIDADKAINIAQTSAAKLTFKSYGMSVGKIDKSWNDVKETQFVVVEEGEDNYIVKATNPKISEVLYFDIRKNGKITDVNNSNVFKKGHGHTH